jgi:hypothetical protein
VKPDQAQSIKGKSQAADDPHLQPGFVICNDKLTGAGQRQPALSGADYLTFTSTCLGVLSSRLSRLTRRMPSLSSALILPGSTAFRRRELSSSGLCHICVPPYFLVGKYGLCAGNLELGPPHTPQDCS